MYHLGLTDHIFKGSKTSQEQLDIANVVTNNPQNSRDDIRGHSSLSGTLIIIDIDISQQARGWIRVKFERLYRENAHIGEESEGLP